MCLSATFLHRLLSRSLVSNIKKSVIANYLGSGWSFAIYIALIPVYISYLGVESFGVIGFITMLQMWLFILDLGITATVSREAARFMAGVHSTQSFRDLVRSLELVFIGIALCIIGLTYFSSELLTEYWLRIDSLQKSTVEDVLSLSGILFAIKWITGFYRGALVGMQQQIWINCYGAVFSTVRGLGVVGILAWIAPTLYAFITFQIFITVVECIFFIAKTYSFLSQRSMRSRFRFSSLRGVCKFSAGMSFNMLLALLVSQSDKIILSKLLSLTEFGYYTLASTVAAGLYVLTGSVTNVAYPKFVYLISKNDHDSLIRIYHTFSQLVSVIIIPPSLLLAVYSERIMYLWLGDSITASTVAPILSILIIGTMINCLMQVPYYLQTAYGWTGLNIAVNLICLLIVVPAIYLSVPAYGTIAPPIIWLLINICIFIITIPIMHSKLIPSEMRSWYVDDTLVPTFFVLLIICFTYFYIYTFVADEPFSGLLTVFFGGTIGLLGGIFAAPLVRNRLIDLVKR